MTVPSTAPTASDEPLRAAELAARYGLHRIGARPPLLSYIRQIWERRHFIWALASARSYNRKQNNYLGQLWTVLNPLILAAVYYLVFGVILGTGEGTDNYVGFLVIGIFSFQYFAGTVSAGASSISGNMAMIRALHFPRASLPMSVSLSEFLTFLPALVVMVLIVVATGEAPVVTWLLAPVAVVLLMLFNTGIALAVARIVVGARDLKNLIPVSTRLMRYVSGVFWSIGHYTGDNIGGYIMEYQPVAVYLNLMRSALLDEFEIRLELWLIGAGWTLLALILGFLVFWRAEERYGRD